MSGAASGAAGDFLAGMAAASRARSAAAQAELPARELLASVKDLHRAPALKLSSFDLIAEVKLRSPAVGLLKAAADEDVGERVATYARAGAAAVSILTEPSRFDGSLDDLERGAHALHPLAVRRRDPWVRGNCSTRWPAAMAMTTCAWRTCWRD